MKPEVISGVEKLATPDPVMQKLIDFYRAFNQRDMALMQQNWEQSAEASMSNPLGGVKRGWEAIRQVYEHIFNGPAEVYVEYYDYSLHQAGEMFTVVGRERGYFKRGDIKLDLAIRTSRIYRQVNGEWRQLHHHGSIDAPQLLADYQHAVLNGQTQ